MVYTQATLATLLEVVEATRNRLATRLGSTATQSTPLCQCDPSGFGGRRRGPWFAPQISQREIDSIASRIAPELDAIIAGVELENAHMPASTRQYHGGELRLLRAIRHVIVEQMLEKIA